MLLYGCFNIDISGPQTQYLKTFPKFSWGADLQPLRASRTLSFPQTHRFGVCSFNANESRRFKEEGGGGALSSLRPQCALFTVDVSQWPLALFCKYSRSPGALYLNDIILCIDICHIIYITDKSCVSLHTIL